MFNVIGALAGFALTGVQSVSRTVVGQVCPEEKSAEFYGLFSVAGQISNFTGPAIYGLLATALALRFFEPRGPGCARRRGGWHAGRIVSIIGFLVVGLVFLLFVQRLAAGRLSSAPMPAEPIQTLAGIRYPRRRLIRGMLRGWHRGGLRRA